MHRESHVPQQESTHMYDSLQKAQGMVHRGGGLRAEQRIKLEM